MINFCYLKASIDWKYFLAIKSSCGVQVKEVQRNRDSSEENILPFKPTNIGEKFLEKEDL